uniref:Uncharacterized protein n=1 Tax=Ralstonia solanacearum TaxID=305 RepID=A0A0S4U5R3_RALSL|nr:protein of unknown function [Ralstonia solanacearum]
MCDFLCDAHAQFPRVAGEDPHAPRNPFPHRRRLLFDDPRCETPLRFIQEQHEMPRHDDEVRLRCVGDFLEKKVDQLALGLDEFVAVGGIGLSHGALSVSREIDGRACCGGLARKLVGRSWQDGQPGFQRAELARSGRKPPRMRIDHAAGNRSHRRYLQRSVSLGTIGKAGY